jgi:hypothetical protein
LGTFTLDNGVGANGMHVNHLFGMTTGVGGVTGVGGIPINPRLTVFPAHPTPVTWNFGKSTSSGNPAPQAAHVGTHTVTGATHSAGHGTGFHHANSS